MPDLTSSPHDVVIHRLLEADDSSPGAVDSVVLDGGSAAALSEALVAEAAGLSASFPMVAAARALRRSIRPGRTSGSNQGSDRQIKALEGKGPRAALASAIGLATAGLRAATFLDGDELAAVRDQLDLIAGRHLPLVVHGICRAPIAHGVSSGSGHESYHGCADAGLFQLLAINAQEATDLALIARRTAEQALVAGLVAMDSGETALSPQVIHPPDRRLVASFLGRPEDPIASPTPAQEILFGSTRRRVPRWFDLERPAMTGPLCNRESWALGAAARGPFFDRHLQDCLEESFTRFAEATGRRYDSLLEHSLDGAHQVIIAQGSMVEIACAVADHLRATSKLKVGVLGIRCLRPFPGARIAEILRRRREVLVVERAGTPLAGEPPLMREIRATLQCTVENERHGSQTHPGYPSYSPKEMPRLIPAVAGLGGLPVRAADLAWLCRNSETLNRSPGSRSPIYLGLEFASPAKGSPKRQVMVDQVREAYPDVEHLGRRSPDFLSVSPDGALTAVVVRRTGQGGDSLATEAAALLARVIPTAQLRGRQTGSWDAWGALCCDRFTLSRGTLFDPGDQVSADAVLLTSPADLSAVRMDGFLADGACLIVEADDLEGVARPAWPAELAAAARDGNIRLFRTPARARADASGSASGENAGRDPLRHERLLGALMAALSERKGVEISVRRLVSSRKDWLEQSGLAGVVERIDAFREGLEQMQPITAEQIEPLADGAMTVEPEVPLAVRHIRPQGEHAAGALDSLPRFWGDVGILYATGETDDLSADPHLATGVIPPLSSTFHDQSASRIARPFFEAALCTGCGRCWSACPDGAIGCVAMGPDRLLEAGVKIARSNGIATDPLRPLISKLAPSLAKTFKKADPPPVTAGALLESACRGLIEKMPFPEDRKQAVVAAFDGVRDALADLPIARAEPFFMAAEKCKPGTGEVLSLAINIDACKGCLACVAVCEPEALVVRPEGAGADHLSNRAEARRAWKLFEQLPDSSGETIERARHDPQIGTLPGILLSRHCQFAMAGGDGAESGSGARLAIRLSLAEAEYHLQPRLEKHLAEIEAVRSRVSQQIREMLADALPAGDLKSLAEGLEAIHQSHVSLADLAGRVNDAFADRPVDTVRLMRLVNVGQELADLHWRISHGPFGLGRARIGMVIESDELTRGIGVFPHNPFQAPVVVDVTGQAPALARGLLEGQMREVLAAFGLVRKAHLEIDAPREAELAAPDLERLRLDQLTDEERDLCPPLLLVAGSDAFRDLSFIELLDAGLPVKVLLLSDAGDRLDAGSGRTYHHNDLGVLARALAYRETFVVQTSLSRLDHLGTGLEGAFAHAGPAIIHIHTPSPALHGFAKSDTLAQADLAVRTRAFPLFTFDPGRKGLFGTRLDISGNPEATAQWVSDETGRELNPAVWALSEKRFAHLFTPLAKDAPGPTPLNSYMALDPRERAGKTPFVATHSTSETGEKAERLAVADEIVQMVERRARDWRVLQELCGKVTPFTELIRKEAEQAVAAEHERKLAALGREYEQKIAQLKTEFTTEAAQRIRERLLAMAGMTPGPHGS